MKKWIAIVAVSLTLTGSGTIGEIGAGWSVTEECTPAAPGDLGGSVGSVGLTAGQGEDSEFVIDNLSTFTHDRLGSINGKVATATSNGASEDTDSTIGMSLTTTLSRLNADRTALPIWFEDFSPADFGSYAGDTGGPVAGTFNGSLSIAVNQTTGDVYATSWADYYGTTGSPVDRRKVIRFDSAGNYLSEWGGLGTGNSQFSGYPAPAYENGGPSGIAVNSSTGNVYVVDVGSDAAAISNQRVQIFSSTGSFISSFGSAGSGNGRFGYTAANPIAISPVDGSVYVGDRANTRIQKFTSAGVYVAQVSTSGFFTSGGPYDIAVDSTGMVYATMVGTTGVPSVIRVYNSSLALQREITMNYPDAVSSGASGFLSIDVAPDDTLWLGLAYQNFVVNLNPTTGAEINRIYSGFSSSLNVSETYVIATSAYNNAVYMLARWVAIGTPVFPITSKRIQAFLYQPIPLSQCIQTYIDLIDPTLLIDYNASADPGILAPGWSGNLWEKLKELCAAYNIQIDCINNVITVSDLGTRTLDLDGVQGGSVSLALDSRATGRSIDIVNYNTSGGSGVLYDATDDNRILTLDIGQDTVEAIQTTSYPVSVNQVSQTDSVNILPGQYYVIASDNLPVTAEEWAAYGASVTVSVGTAPGTIDVHLVGPTSTIPGVSAPYSLAISDGSTTRPAFSVTGTGVFTTPEPVNLLTGADPDKTPVEVAQTIDNIFLSSRDLAYDRGIWASVIASGPLLTLNATVPTTVVTGFGLAEGSIVSFKESAYRVTTANIDNAWTRISATRHATVGDYDLLNAGRTVGQHDTLWDGNECEDEFIKPYRT